MEVLLPAVLVVVFGVIALMMPRLNLPWTVYVAYLGASAVFFLGMAIIEGRDELYKNLIPAALAIGLAIRFYRIGTTNSARSNFAR